VASAGGKMTLVTVGPAVARTTGAAEAKKPPPLATGGTVVRVAPRMEQSSEETTAEPDTLACDSAAEATEAETPLPAMPPVAVLVEGTPLQMHRAAQLSSDGEPMSPLSINGSGRMKKLSERRASGSQLSPPMGGGGGGGPGLVRRVSRPSTPISRTERPSLVHSPKLSGTALALVVQTNNSSPPPDPLGWGVAPTAPQEQSPSSPGASAPVFARPKSFLTLSPPGTTVGSRGASALSVRRRTANATIPETIQERLKPEPAAAQGGLLSPAILEVPHPADKSRRASGGALSIGRSYTRNGLAPLRSEAAPAGSASARPDDAPFSGGGSGVFGGRIKLGRYELTDAQERELREKPYLWTDPAIYTDHPDAVFAYYASLPSSALGAVSIGAETAAAAPEMAGSSPKNAGAGSLSFLPSIHAGERIVWPGQVQRLARDCIQRLYLLVKRDLRRTHPELFLDKEDKPSGVASAIGSDSALERKVWSVLERLLPGHGHEGQTLHWVSLYLLSSLARSGSGGGGSIGKREFALLFPPAHLALFAAPGDAAASTLGTRERRKVIQQCYALKIEELLKPAPVPPGAGAAANGRDSPTAPAVSSGFFGQWPALPRVSSVASSSGRPPRFARDKSSRRHSSDRDELHELAAAAAIANGERNLERRGSLSLRGGGGGAGPLSLIRTASNSVSDNGGPGIAHAAVDKLIADLTAAPSSAVSAGGRDSRRLSHRRRASRSPVRT